MRWDAKTDLDQSELAQAARAWGASVQLLHRVGQGCPDLLIGYTSKNGKRVNLLVEVKTMDGDLNERQREWHEGWRGQVAVVRSISQLEKLLLSVE